MRFVDLLRTTVLLSAAAATTLAVITVAAATADGDDRAVIVAAAWWFVAALIGAFVGRRNQVSQAIGRLLADAKAATMMPEHRPAAVAVNRLWPLLLSTVAAGALGLIAPQIPGIAAGFAVIWALAWRRQESAVRAIEERDGATFFVEPTSPVRPLRLVRTPGFRREVPTFNGSGA
ncbi:MAG: hypothetical protein QOH72_2108 [Solirubrobacteraceae bacterium]|nr:hypothetical protein [Solirubrobacteraceae bacterium]